MTHDEVRELVPIFALDALGDDEELEVRSHLQACPDCRQSLDAYQQTADSLALAAAPVAVPDGLRQRVLDAAAASPQLGAPTLVRPGGETAGAKAEARLRQRGDRRRNWWQVATAVAAVLVVIVGGVSISLARQLHSSHHEVAQQRSFIAALGAPGLATVPMVAATTGERAAGQLYVAASGKSAGLVVTGLPNPGSDVYELWLIVNDVPSPVVAFRPDSSGQALVPVNADLAQMQAMAITREHRAGNASPQGPKVLQTA